MKKCTHKKIRLLFQKLCDVFKKICYFFKNYVMFSKKYVKYHIFYVKDQESFFIARRKFLMNNATYVRRVHEHFATMVTIEKNLRHCNTNGYEFNESMIRI
jgi:hypothetical protein